MKETASATSDDMAGAKIWSKNTDKALVDRWRSDMEGLAGLFSTCLTAFLVESYKSLGPDSGQLTVDILTQISAQLAAGINGTTFELPTMNTRPTGPTTAALACNIMWFTSLFLALLCAFMATMKCDPSPIIRARIFSYLYYGVKKFTFLFPINTVITNMAATLLCAVLVIYCTLTILPMIYYDCPYRTALSPLLWRVRQGILIILAKWVFPQGESHPDEELTVTSCYQPSLDKSSMLEMMTHSATRASEEREARDKQALVWTVKSLTDDDELEPFVEGVSSVLWGAKGRRNTYDEHIKSLICDPEVSLVSRIEIFLKDCSGGQLPVGVEIRRQISSLKALWAIARMSIEKPDNLSLLQVLSRSSSAAVQQHYIGLRELIGTCSDSKHNAEAGSSSQRLNSVLKRVQRQMTRLRPSVWLLNPENIDYFHGELPSETFIANETIDESSRLWFIRGVSNHLRFLEDAPSCIFLRFLEDSASADSMPYEFFTTYSSLPIKTIPPASVERSLERMISTHAARLKLNPGVHHIDSISPSFDSAPWIVQYLNCRDSPEALSEALLGCRSDCLAALRLSLKALSIWRLCMHARRVIDPETKSQVPYSGFDQATLLAVQSAEFSLCSPAVNALVQWDILISLTEGSHEDKALLMATLSSPIFPMPSSEVGNIDSPLPTQTLSTDTNFTMDMRHTEAAFTILSDFLDHCEAEILPLHSAETIEYIANFIPRAKLDASLQRRFVSCISAVIRDNRTPAHAVIINTVLLSSIFDTYPRQTSSIASNPSFNADRQTNFTSPIFTEFLDDPEARSTLIAALKRYATTLPPGQFPATTRRITAILFKIGKAPPSDRAEPLPSQTTHRKNFHQTLGMEYRVLRPTKS
ncbi:hypothetical protein R3P38DRAFT_3073832 [Favolaschia claudopus]|uniref:DUF6535 domain-containing protein n=1 Tax=Favolaschia claudopus TaxID=2862362 RepID=A0AAV9ZY94_9AGAR